MSELKNLIFDVGMHKGEDTDFYLKKGFKVVSFEADPDLATLCRERFQEEVKTDQLTIVEGAIIDIKNHKGSSDKIKFFKNKKTSVWGTVVEDWADRNTKLGSDSEVIEVSIIDFSESLKQFGIPYYLKIDIEGMDVICLNALLDYVKRPDYISIESEKVSFDNLLEEFRIFKELGYGSFQMINQSKISSFKEPRAKTEGKFLNYKFQHGSTGLFGTDLKNNRWQSSEKSIKQYKKIFKGYKYFGDDSRLNKYIHGRILGKLLNKLFGLLGWYDTHAKHSSVKT